MFLLHHLLLFFTIHRAFCEDPCPILATNHLKVDSFDTISVYFIKFSQWRPVQDCVIVENGYILQHETNQQTCLYRKKSNKSFMNDNEWLIFDFNKGLGLFDAMVCGSFDSVTGRNLRSLLSVYVNTFYSCNVSLDLKLNLLYSFDFKIAARKKPVYFNFTREVPNNLSREEWEDLKNAATVSLPCSSIDAILKKCLIKVTLEKNNHKLIYTCIFVLALCLIFAVVFIVYYCYMHNKSTA